jgi:hypothetical protein
MLPPLEEEGEPQPPQQAQQQQQQQHAPAPQRQAAPAASPKVAASVFDEDAAACKVSTPQGAADTRSSSALQAAAASAGQGREL